MKTKNYKTRARSNKLLLAIMGTITLAAIIIALLVTGGPAKQAKADAETYTYDQSYLAKNVQASSVATFNKTFTFTLTPYSYNESTATADVAKIPNVTAQTITVSATDGTAGTGCTKVSGNQTTNPKKGEKGFDAYIGELQLSSFMPAASSFPNAGLYTYLVTETGPADGDTNWDYSEASYYVNVYVENGESGLDVAGCTFTQTIDDFGNEIAVTKKDPSEETGKSNEIIDVQTTETTPTTTHVYSGFTFMNLYDPKTDLLITNHIEGQFSDKTLEYTYAVQLFNNMYNAGDTVTAKVSKDGVIASETTVTFTFDANGYATTTDTIKLTDNGYIKFDSLPVGTQYGVTETGISPYITKHTTVSKVQTGGNDTTVTVDYPATGGEGAGADYSYWNATSPNAACILGLNTGNTSDIYNKRIDVTPTGILVNIAPYLILLGLPICAIVAWLLVRRAKKNRR